MMVKNTSGSWEWNICLHHCLWYCSHIYTAVKIKYENAEGVLASFNVICIRGCKSGAWKSRTDETGKLSTSISELAYCTNQACWQWGPPARIISLWDSLKELNHLLKVLFKWNGPEKQTECSRQQALRGQAICCLSNLPEEEHCIFT